MRAYRHGSPTTGSIPLPIVWITQDRHKGGRGEVAERVRAIVREECQQARVAMLPGPLSPAPVHVLSSLPPHVTISRLIQRMQGQRSSRLLAGWPPLRQRFWGRPV